MVVAYLFAKENYNDKIELKVEEMVHYLKKAFKQVILEQKWLSEDFKSTVVEKVLVQ